MAEPSIFHAGASLTWEKSAPDYPASSGYSLEYVLAGPSGRVVIGSGVITGSGSTFTVTVPMSTTATWPAGEYTWRLFATKTGERWHLEDGVVRVVASATGPTDQRTHAKRMVDALEAVLQRKATRDQQEITISGKTLKRMTLEELTVAHAYWTRMYQQELDAAKVAAGMTSRRVIRTRFRGL